MGSCNYYLRASFDSRENAENAVEKMVEMLRQNQEAYEFWQTNRGSKTMTPAEFWQKFSTQFPLVCEVLNCIEKDTQRPNPIGTDDTNNSLSGILGFIGLEDDINNVQIVKHNPAIATYVYEIQYFSEVWHFNTWKHFAAWMKNLGASDARWTSEELLEEKPSFPDF